MREFDILAYEVKLGPEIYGYFTPKVDDVVLKIGVEAGGIIRCLAKEKDILILYFLNENSQIPPPHFIKDKETEREGLVMFLPYDRISDYIDLLRNESPIKAVIEKQLERSHIKTLREKVGEGERR